MKIFLCVVGLGLAGALAADEQRFTFALPEEEGRISLGVFDDKGALVRTLAVGAEVEDFAIGLNGLMTSWNGWTDQGQKAPAGKYFVRGFVVGDEVETEGVAYHFNDWVEDGEADRFAWIRNFQLLPDGGLVVVAARSMIQALSPVVVRYFPGRGVVWSRKLDDIPQGGGHPSRGAGFPSRAPFLSTGTARLPITFVPTGVASGLNPSLRPPVVADEEFIAMGLGSRLCFLSTKNGDLIFGANTPSAPASSLALGQGTLWVGAWGGLTKFILPEWAEKTRQATPVSFSALALVDDKLIGGGSGTAGVWRQDGVAWQKLEIPLTAGSISAGRAKTFWVAGSDPTDGRWQVGEFGLEGEFHSSYRGDLPPVLVSASGSRVGVLEENTSRQRLIILERNTEAADQPWEIVFEKTIQRSLRFEVTADGLKSEGGPENPPRTVALALDGHGLESSSREVPVQVLRSGGEIWLATASGLKILPVSQEGKVGVRLALRKNPDSLTVYAGDGMVVEEFVIRGLERQLAPIEAGEIDLP